MAQVRPIIRYNPQDLLRAGNVSVDEVVVVVTRLDESDILTQRVPFPPDQSSLSITLSVPLESDPETVFIAISLLGQGNLLFSGGSSVTLSPGTDNPDPQIAVSYFGPGSNIGSLTLDPRDTTIFVGNSFTYDLTARDSQGVVLALFYATWSLTSANGVDIDANGRVRGTAPGSALVQARVPNTTVSNFATLRVLAAPTAITRLDGDGIIGAPGDTIFPVRVGVETTGGAFLGNAPVRWRVLSGGGAVFPSVVNTDTEGVATVTIVLGAAPGTNTIEASVNGLTTVFTLQAQLPQNVVFLDDNSGATTILQTTRLGVFTSVAGTAGGTFTYPRWSPNRVRVAYSAVPGVGITNLWVVDAALRTPVQIVTDTNTYRARWNPAGTHLAFGCGAAPFDLTEDVCVILNTASQAVPIAPGVGNGAGRNVLTDGLPQPDGPGAFAWDPVSGDSVLVARIVRPVNLDHSALYMVAANRSGFRRVGPAILQVANDTMRVIDIAMAPNGAYAVLVAQTPASPGGALFRINRDGSGLVRLTNNTGFIGDRVPSVSPDNTQICFVRGDLADGLLAADTYRIGATGGVETQVTAEGSALGDGGFFSLNRYTCDWSPDGQELVVVGTVAATGSRTLFRVNSTTTSATYATDRVLIARAVAGVDDLEAAWRP